MKMRNLIKGLISISITACLVTGCAMQTEAKKVENMMQYVTDIEAIKVPDDVKIIGLGEATHGNSEFQVLKQEVFEAVLEHNGCKIFAIEGDFGGCQKVNDYILTGEGTAKEAVEAIGFEIYRTQEMENLVQWMHNYNQGVTDDEKIKFYGFDMQRYDYSKEGLLSYLGQIDEKLAKSYEEKLADLNNSTVYTPAKEKIEYALSELNTLMMEMSENRAIYIKETSEKEYTLALQYAQCLKENATLQLGKANYSQTRDTYMSQKVKWILEYEEDEKLFITGHNGHITKSKSGLSYTTMGSRLFDEFGDAYYAIGTDFYQSTFRANNSKGEAKHFTLKNNNTLIEQFMDLPHNMYFLDFEKAKTQPELKAILEHSQSMANIGSEFNEWQKLLKMSYTLSLVPDTSYDGMIMVKEATPTHIEK